MGKLTLVIGNKNYSSWSLRAWLTMKQVGLKFNEILVPILTPTSPEQIRRYSPSGQVPVLIDGNFKVWESLAICEYVADRFSPNLWPKDLNARAIARAVSTEMHAGFINLRQYLPMDCRSRYPGEEITPNVQADIDRIKTIWRECRKEYGKSGDFLFGKFSIADAMFAPVTTRFITYGIDLDPVAEAYVEAIWGLPAMQEWLADAANESESLTHIKP